MGNSGVYLQWTKFVGIVGFKSFFTLWFYNGVFLEDKHNVLVSAQEGVTKAMRQWRFSSMEDIDEKLVQAYIQEAIANEEQGKKLKLQRKEKLPIPSILTEAFKEDQAFEKSFVARPQAKQNEYVEHIQSAKQEATKSSRLQKIRPLVMQGKGMRDKYKNEKRGKVACLF